MQHFSHYADRRKDIWRLQPVKWCSKPAEVLCSVLSSQSAEASSRCWKILVPIYTTASFSCCRCTFMMWSFRSTKSWGSTTGLSLGGCGGHLSLCDKVLSPAGSNHQKMVHCGYTGMDIVRFQTILCKHGDGCDNLNYSDQHPRHDQGLWNHLSSPLWCSVWASAGHTDHVQTPKCTELLLRLADCIFALRRS